MEPAAVAKCQLPQPVDLPFWLFLHVTYVTLLQKSTNLNQTSVKRNSQIDQVPLKYTALTRLPGQPNAPTGQYKRSPTPSAKPMQSNSETSFEQNCQELSAFHRYPNAHYVRILFFLFNSIFNIKLVIISSNIGFKIKINIILIHCIPCTF